MFFWLVRVLFIRWNNPAVAAANTITSTMAAPKVMTMSATC